MIIPAYVLDDFKKLAAPGNRRVRRALCARVERLTIPADAHPEHERCQSAVRNSIQLAEDSALALRRASCDFVIPAIALLDSPDLAKFAGRVSDSGAGRWTITAAIDESVPAPVLSAALYERFSSRGEDGFAEKVLCTLRYGFGGHEENAATLWPARARSSPVRTRLRPSGLCSSQSLKPTTGPTRTRKAVGGRKMLTFSSQRTGCWHNPEPKEDSG